MKLAVGSDEAGYNLKKDIVALLKSLGHEVKDFGNDSADQSVLYPDIAVEVAEHVAQKEFERGILICGTGIGMSICANKVKGIRAAVCHDVFSTERSRRSNDAQVMCLGARVIGAELAKELVRIWLECEFEAGGSTPKVERILQYEQRG